MANLTTKQYTATEKLVFSFGIIVILVTGYALTNFSKPKLNLSKNESSQINYEMAKLQTSESLYSLADREIAKRYKALEVAKAKTATLAATKKAITDKTKAAVTKKADATKAPVTKAAVLPKSAQPGKLISNLNNSQATVQTEAEAPQSVTPQSAHAASPAAANDVLPPSEVVTKKTYAEWRNEIFTAQNKEAVLKLSNAFKKNEVTIENFQRLVTEMLSSKDDKIVGLGLYALRATPSYASFIQLVKVQSSLSSSYAAYVQEALNSYNQISGLSVLKQTLLSSDRVVVMKTLDIIKVGLNSIQNGTTSELVDSRYRRDYIIFSVSNYTSFMPLLQSIATNSDDQDIINLANQNMNMIDPQFVASN